ncbi:MAG: hypothetical protein ACK5C5_10825 [Bacteroidota bacterium]|jgi:hypothetical protein
MEKSKTFRKLQQLATAIVIMLFSVQASAQNSVSDAGTDPVQVYLEKNTDGALLRLYKLSPEDKDILRAINIWYIQNDLTQVEKMSASDLKLLEQESIALNNLFKQIDELVRKGNSFERAKIHVINNQQNAKLEENQTPGFKAAPAK